jgi:hypothetical protein
MKPIVGKAFVGPARKNRIIALSAADACQRLEQPLMAQTDAKIKTVAMWLKQHNCK